MTADPTGDARALVRRYRRRRFWSVAPLLGLSVISCGVTAQQGYGTVAGVIAAAVLLSATCLAPFLWKQRQLEAHRPADSFHRCMLSLSATSVQRSAVMNRVTDQRVDPRRFPAAKDWVGLTVDFTSQGLRCTPDKYTARRGVQPFFLGTPTSEASSSLEWAAARPIWQQGSADFAGGASGTVHVFQSAAGLRLESVWATIEYPILQKNGVTIIYRVVGKG
jgi:hypothetical protein